MGVAPLYKSCTYEIVVDPRYGFVLDLAVSLPTQHDEAGYVADGEGGGWFYGRILVRRSDSMAGMAYL